MQIPLEGLDLAPFSVRPSGPRTQSWLKATLAAYVAGARILATTLCSEHVCDVSDHGEDWLAIPTGDTRQRAHETRHCHECGQHFMPPPL